MPAPYRRRVLPALSLLCSGLMLLTGCNLVNFSNLNSPGTGSGGGSSPGTTTDFTGNYTFAGTPNAAGVLPTPVEAFVGAIANTGSTVTATLRLLSANQCVSTTQDLAFTGTVGSSGQINLSSTTLPQNPIAITFDDNPAQSSNGIGTYIVSGSGPCAMPSTSFVSDQYSPVTGTYTGTFTGTTGTAATVTATLTQAPANADGQFPESGTLVLTTAACTNTFTVVGTVTGPLVTITFNPTASGTLGGFVGQIPDHALTMAVPAGIQVLGACNPGTFTGGLVKQ